MSMLFIYISTIPVIIFFPSAILKTIMAQAAPYDYRKLNIETPGPVLREPFSY
jgi:hypothetical protein